MAYVIPRCRIIPLPDNQVSFQIDGEERTRWHFGLGYERPFFYPFNGPSGSSLTRMGHPGAPNHDHHRSVWFAHAKVLGIDFWSNSTAARIRQTEWLCYTTGDSATMATRLHWYDGHDPQELLKQNIIATISPGPQNETFLEIQTEFLPRSESLEFQQTNFGFLAIRVAENIAEYFGGGLLTNSFGKIHEKNIFGQPSRWMDYSGPVPGGATEGITYFDHPANPGFPNRWHVREDGWMGCSPCMKQGLTTSQKKPLELRFLLHAHQGAYDHIRAEKIAIAFAKRPGYDLVNRPKKHTSWGIKQRNT